MYILVLCSSRDADGAGVFGEVGHLLLGRVPMGIGLQVPWSAGDSTCFSSCENVAPQADDLVPANQMDACCREAPVRGRTHRPKTPQDCPEAIADLISQVCQSCQGLYIRCKGT